MIPPLSNTAADHHVRTAVCIQPGIILREQPLIGSDHSTDKRQPELAAMRMACKDQSNAAVYLRFKQLHR